MKYEKQFRKYNPQTIGETETAFDYGNYIDWLDEQHSQLLKQRDELQACKNSAMKIMCNIDLQKVGKLIGVRLGDDVSTEVIPFIEKTVKQNNEMRELLKEVLYGEQHPAQLKFKIDKLIESTNP